MNVTSLFVGTAADAKLIHVGSAATRVSRKSAELSRNVGNLSQALRELGIRPGNAVLIIGGSRVEIAESILSVFNIGALAVPVSALLGATNLCRIIERVRPSCCIFEDAPEAAVQAALAECSSAMISIKASLEARAHGWFLHRDLIERHCAPLTFDSHAPEQPALLVHGSGSSGALKTIVMSHERLMTFCEYNRLVYAQYSDGPGALTSAASIVSSLPLAHLAGLGNMLLALMTGHTIYLLSTFLPDVYLRLIEEARCAHILLVPSMYRSLLREPYLAKMDKSALRFCIIGGEPSPPELLEEISGAFGVPVATAYSMTECLSGIAHLRRDLFRKVKPGSCGRPFFGEVSLRDAEGVEQARFGELWVRNATVHPCYLDPALNAQRLKDGWFRTGDLFCRDEEGDYFHRGRADDMFICNGKNIYPVEIEQLLATHPAVDAACAGPVVLPGKGTVPGVVVLARAAVSAGALQEFCMRAGSSHAVPQLIRLVESLPLLGPGKIDRRAALAQLQGSPGASS